MIEFIASIGFLGVAILVIGYVLIFWMAQVIDARDPYNYDGDEDEQ
jgi:hypothetical protein